MHAIYKQQICLLLASHIGYVALWPEADANDSFVESIFYTLRYTNKWFKPIRKHEYWSGLWELIEWEITQSQCRKKIEASLSHCIMNRIKKKKLMEVMWFWCLIDFSFIIFWAFIYMMSVNFQGRNGKASSSPDVIIFKLKHSRSISLAERVWLLSKNE